MAHTTRARSAQLPIRGRPKLQGWNGRSWRWKSVHHGYHGCQDMVTLRMSSDELCEQLTRGYHWVVLMFRLPPPSLISFLSSSRVYCSTGRPLSPSRLHPTSYVSSLSPSMAGTLTRSKNEPFISSAHSLSRSLPTSSPSPPPRSHLDTSPCVSCPHPSTRRLSSSCLGSLRQ